MLRSTLFVCLALSISYTVKAENQISNFESSLGHVVQLFQNDDCDHALANDSAQNLIEACKEAHETPEVTAVRGNFSCSFDLENYVVAAKTGIVTPEYHISPSGDVKQIVKGDLSVTARECKKIIGEKGTAGRHPATEDLCFSYYPDKSFAQYQEKACSESRKPASNVTTPPAASAPATEEIDEDGDSDVASEVQHDLVSYEMAVR